MHPRFYKIIDTINKGDYLYEVVECGGQTGVRCRTYVKPNELFSNELDKYQNTKYYYHFKKFLNKRHPQLSIYKFEAFAWCWPYDTFNLDIGMHKSREKVDNKIKSKKYRIKKFIKHLENNNLPKIS